MAAMAEAMLQAEDAELGRAREVVQVTPRARARAGDHQQTTLACLAFRSNGHRASGIAAFPIDAPIGASGTGTTMPVGVPSRTADLTPL